MRRRLILLALPIAALGGLVAASGHVATAASRTQVPQVTGTFTDKPYTATTPDSGSCGNNWALDLFARSFVIHPQNSDGTWTVTEHFNNGRFITLGDGETGSLVSPGHCDRAGNTHTLKEGVSGTFNGSFTITIATGHTYTGNRGCSSNETIPGATIDDGCTTAAWVHNAFAATYPTSDAQVTAYSLTYHTVGLIGNTWTDASIGDSGDIYSTS
jgi:hypothetical protein